MSQVEKHLEWCLKDSNRLTKIKTDIECAKKHLKKSEYNFGVMQELETLKRYDWAINVGFYSIYHCFLAILAKYGFESKNQSCTITVLLSLIEKQKISLDKDIVLQFDTFDTEKDSLNPTIRTSRELSTYGVETSINNKQLNNLKNLIVKVQKETIKILSE